jgi:hypothetical protein
MKHYNVVIATPGRMFHSEYVQSLVKTLEALTAEGLTYTFLNKYSSFVPTARELTAIDRWDHNYDSNEIAEGKFTYDKLFWIDSDVEWDPEDFLALYKSELEIVSGLYAIDQYGKLAVGYPNEHGAMTSVQSVEFLLHTEPVEVGGVGFGFLCVKSGVFENIPRPWFLIGKMKWSPDSEIRVNVGEDYSWCGQAQRAGYKIYVNPLIKLKHHKETIFEVK